MEDLKKAILLHSHYGLKIYAFILRNYFPGEIVIQHYGPKPILTRNPFQNNRNSLYLEKSEHQYLFFDTEDSGFSGNVFDFASLFFKQKGKKLLIEIINNLNLKGILIDRYGDDFLKDLEDHHAIPSFSFFKKPISNIYPSESKSLLDVYSIIKSPDLAKETKLFRSINDKSNARKYKATNFDYVTFSGIFSNRRDRSLISHSGLLTIDFDNIINTQELSENLLHDQYFETELHFTSPSGNGLKWIIPIDTKEVSHQEYFKAVANYIQQTYKTQVDQSGKDVSRACFLCHDENAFINPKYLEDV
jgi:hypothetical protein